MSDLFLGGEGVAKRTPKALAWLGDSGGMLPEKNLKSGVPRGGEGVKFCRFPKIIKHIKVTLEKWRKGPFMSLCVMPGNFAFGNPFVSVPPTRPR